MNKILIIITTGVVEYGGLFNVMKNYLYNMNRNNLELSITACNVISPNLTDELKSKHITYHKLYSRKKNPLRYAHELFKLIRKEKYSIVHINGNSSTMIIETLVSLFAGVKNRMVHCHTTKSGFPVYNRILSPFFNCTYTFPVAVSSASGKWLYGRRQFLILRNAIMLSKFCFCSVIREEYRENLNIRENIVIGSIGKLNQPKNHIFLLEVLKQLLQYNRRYILLLVGEGDEREKLQKRAVKLNIQEHVIMLGARTDNSELLQAMDIFVFPSLYEGFGMAFLEAQATGMPCVCSDRIPEEVQICKNIDVLELDVDKWVENICQIEKKLGDQNRKIVSDNAIEMISGEGYNIEEEAFKLRHIYDKLND